MSEFFNKKQIYFSVASLVLANLIPLFGVLFWGWDVFSILFIYWLESLIIGFYSVLRICKAARGSTFEKVNSVLFFVLHFGLFMAGHGFFLFIFFLSPPDSVLETPPLQEIIPQGMIIMFLSLFFSHGLSYLVNFIGNKEFQKATPSYEMLRPYKRVVLMHLTILFGGFVSKLFGANVFLLLIMIFLKIIFDIEGHLREHLKTRLLFLPSWSILPERGASFSVRVYFDKKKKS